MTLGGSKMKRFILFILLCILLPACGENTTIYDQCTVEGQYLVCPDGTRSELPRSGVDGRDGVDGTDGRDGADGSIIAVYDPCGDDVGVADEIILVLGENLSNRTFLAWYRPIGLSVLEPGITYRTTDRQRCRFQIINNEVVEL